MFINIGTWHEKESRELTQHTSYAADYIIHKTKAGDYPAGVSFEGGFTIPMPQWLLIGLDTDIINGEIFSGFCGNNFASTKVTKEPSKYTIQTYSYYIPEFVKAGILTLNKDWEWLNNDTTDIINYIKQNNITWDYLKQFAVK